MRRLIVIVSFLTVACARPETYREKEDFQYSRSSSDDGTKAGFYGAQRGNMGGNYERAHNMDSLAQHQMGSLVTQVDGELGSGADSKSGSVYTAGNSRGMFGSGHYDLGVLKGRNFAEGTSFGDSEAHSSASNSGYQGHSYSAKNARYNGRQSQYSSQNLGYRASGQAGSYIDANNQEVDNSQYSNFDQEYRNQQAARNYKFHSQANSQESSQYDQSIVNSNSNSGSNTQIRSMSATPLKVYVRPGSKVTIPIAANTYDASQLGSSHAENTVGSDAELLVNNRPGISYTPTNNGKHYESSYSYRKEWEKHNTLPLATPTENPFPTNSELYDADGKMIIQNSNQNAFDVNSVHGSKSSNAYTSGYKTNSKLSSSQDSRYQTGYNAEDLNIAAGTNSGASAVGAIENSANANNLVEELSTKPKSYHSSYSYHKSWERQGDPYVIKPASGDLSGLSSQRLTSASENYGQHSIRQHGSHYNYAQNAYSQSGTPDCDCDENGLIRVPRSYNNDYQNIQEQNDLGQQIQGQWENVEDLGQQSQSKWDDLEDLGQQSQNKWDNLDVFGQQAESKIEELGDLGQQQNKWDNSETSGQHTLNTNGKLEDLGQQTQNKWDNLEDLGQQTQNKWDNLEVAGHQTESKHDEIEDLGQQSQNKWDNFEALGQDKGNTIRKLEDLGQQAQNNWDNSGNFGQQAESKHEKLEDLGQQSQNKWDDKEAVGQQAGIMHEKLEDLGQQSQNKWDNLEALDHQTVNNNEKLGNVESQNKWDNLYAVGQQAVNNDEKLEDLGQQTQSKWNNLETLNQPSQNKLDNIENIGQINWDNFEYLGQQPQNHRIFDTHSNQNTQSVLEQQSQNEKRITTETQNNVYSYNKQLLHQQDIQNIHNTLQNQQKQYSESIVGKAVEEKAETNNEEYTNFWDQFVQEKVDHQDGHISQDNIEKPNKRTEKVNFPTFYSNYYEPKEDYSKNIHEKSSLDSLWGKIDQISGVSQEQSFSSDTNDSKIDFDLTQLSHPVQHINKKNTLEDENVSQNTVLDKSKNSYHHPQSLNVGRGDIESEDTSQDSSEALDKVETSTLTKVDNSIQVSKPTSTPEIQGNKFESPTTQTLLKEGRENIQKNYNTFDINKSSDNVQQQSINFQIDNLDQQHQKLDTETFIDFDQHTQMQENLPGVRLDNFEQINEKSQNFNTFADNGFPVQSGNEEQQLQNLWQSETNIQNIEKNLNQAIISTDTIAKNHDEVAIPVEIVTEKPSFWKSVGNKFTNAKDSVVSWFKRS